MATTPWIQFNATTQTRNVDGVDEYRLIGVSPKPPFNVSDEINKKQSADIKISKGLISGDSTIAEYLEQEAVATYVLSSGDRLIGSTIDDISVPGNTISQQKTLFLALSDKTIYDYIIVQIGLNDVDPAETPEIAMARYQDYIDTINLNKRKDCLLIIGTMTPCRSRLIDIYGPVDGVVSYDKWLEMNISIMGGGEFPITGVDGRINTHTIALNDGNGNIAPIYDMGDGVHENNIAREIIATSHKQHLNKLGLIKVSNGVEIENYLKEGMKVLTNIIGNISGNALSETLQTTTSRGGATSYMFRIDGAENPFTSGAGLMAYFAGGQATIQAYDIDEAIFKQFNYRGSAHVFSEGDGSFTKKLTVGEAPTDPSGVVRLSDISNYTFINPSVVSPTPTGTGIKGTIIYSGAYRYECIATDTWIRVAMETTW